MLKRIPALMVLAFLLGLASIAPGQEGYTSRKTTEDYLQTVLSRDTKPLGLKENVALRNLLRQRAVKWAIRAGVRHGLD